MKKLAIFDLDGTLLDSLGDLANSCNQALEEAGLPTHPVESYRYFVGGGRAVLLEKSMPKESQTPEMLEKVGNRYNEIYNEVCRNHSKAYDGVLEMLDQLHAKGIKTAVATNKPNAMCQDVMKSVYGARIDLAYGQLDEIAHKPDPAVVYRIMEELGVTDKADVIYVGDSNVDIFTGINAGVTTVGVLWGFRPREELEEAGATLLAQTIDEMYDFIVR